MKAVQMAPLTVEDYRLLPETGPRYQLIIEPTTKQIHVYLLQRDPEEPHATYGARDEFTSPTFPGLKFRASAIFKAQ